MSTHGITLELTFTEQVYKHRSANRLTRVRQVHAVDVDVDVDYEAHFEYPEKFKSSTDAVI